MVCLNHPDVNAVAKCSACGKPLCAECVMIFDNQKYCSEACHLKGLASRLRTAEVISEKRKTGKKSGFRKFVTLLLILAAAAGAAYFYTRHKKTIDRHAVSGLESVKAKTGEAIREGRESMPKSSKYKQHRENLVNDK